MEVDHPNKAGLSSPPFGCVSISACSYHLTMNVLCNAKWGYKVHKHGGTKAK